MVVATYSTLSVFGELEAAHVLGCIHKGDCEVDCSSAKTQWEEENIQGFYAILCSIPKNNSVWQRE